MISFIGEVSPPRTTPYERSVIMKRCVSILLVLAFCIFVVPFSIYADDRYNKQTVTLSGQALIAFLKSMNPTLSVNANGLDQSYSYKSIDLASNFNSSSQYGDVSIPTGSVSVSFNFPSQSIDSVNVVLNRFTFDDVVDISFNNFIFKTGSLSNVTPSGSLLRLSSGDPPAITIHYSSSSYKSGYNYYYVYFNYFDLTGGKPVNVTLPDPSSMVLNASMGFSSFTSNSSFELIISPITISTAKYAIDGILDQLGDIDETLKDIDAAIRNGTITIEDAINEGVQDIIENQDKNTQDLIDNQNKNTDKITDSIGDLQDSLTIPDDKMQGEIDDLDDKTKDTLDDLTKLQDDLDIDMPDLNSDDYDFTKEVWWSASVGYVTDIFKLFDNFSFLGYIFVAVSGIIIIRLILYGTSG